MTSYRLLLPADGIRRPAITDFIWAEAADRSSFVTSLGHRATELGLRSGVALDLVRLAVGVFVVDRTARRTNLGWSRDLALSVPVSDPDAWNARAEGLAGLLDYMTGDHWDLTFRRDRTARVRRTSEPRGATLVSLFSGGLDSFAGAVRGISEGHDIVLLGHHDTTTVRGVQARALGQVEALAGTPPRFIPVRIARAKQQLVSGEPFPRETSSRTRSFLFLALGLAVAHSAGANTLWVPENGWVSVNPPLGPERRGALSTRTTHPALLDEFGVAIRELGLGVSIVNPWEGMTKGEVVRWLREEGGAPAEALADAMPDTHSCARSNANYSGFSPLTHCGVCFACLIRRAAIRAGGVPDRTEYIEEVLRTDGAARRTWLSARRRRDYVSVRSAIGRGFTIEDVVALDLPRRFDPANVLDMAERGLAELDAIRIP